MIKIYRSLIPIDKRTRGTHLFSLRFKHNNTDYLIYETIPEEIFPNEFKKTLKKHLEAIEKII